MESRCWLQIFKNFWFFVTISRGCKWLFCPLRKQPPANIHESSPPYLFKKQNLIEKNSSYLATLLFNTNKTMNAHFFLNFKLMKTILKSLAVIADFGPEIQWEIWYHKYAEITYVFTSLWSTCDWAFNFFTFKIYPYSNVKSCVAKLR